MMENNILRLKEILKEKKITGKDLAPKVGLSETAMSNAVKGQSVPKASILLKIAKELDVDLRELFISTKASESLFIKKNGEYVEVGSIKPFS
jgi:transcriptional regulator with XRE-family HTH domain